MEKTKRSPKTKRRSVADLANDFGAAKRAIELYNDVVRKAQLVEVALLACHFEVNGRVDEETAGLDRRFDREVVSHEFENGLAITIFDWSVRTFRADDEILACNGHWAAVYNGLEGCDADAVCRFSQHVGTLTTYPYFRAFVARTLWDACVNVVPMPVITGSTFAVLSLEELRQRLGAVANE